MPDGLSSRAPVIAIDGPAGAGKSTVARRTAELLGFHFLDTGATYRAATWNALHQKLDLDDSAALAEATRGMKLEVLEEGGRQTVLVNGHDATEAIRSPEVTQKIYYLADNPAVRQHLVELQRQLAAGQPTVAEGRDIGTVVFPDATCKIYLEASVPERVRRRTAELAAKGIRADAETVAADIEDRDRRDKARPVGALRKAPGAVLLDTSHMTPDQAARAIAAIAKERIGVA